jgi:hypothetical protein
MLLTHLHAVRWDALFSAVEMKLRLFSGSARYWTPQDRRVLSETRFWRLGSESQIRCRLLTRLSKPAACTEAYPNGVPQADAAARLGARGTTYRPCAKEPADCFAYQALLENHEDA